MEIFGYLSALLCRKRFGRQFGQIGSQGILIFVAHIFKFGNLIETGLIEILKQAQCYLNGFARDICHIVDGLADLFNGQGRMIQETFFQLDELALLVRLVRDCLYDYSLNYARERHQDNGHAQAQEGVHSGHIERIHDIAHKAKMQNGICGIKDQAAGQDAHSGCYQINESSPFAVHTGADGG